MSTQVNSTVAAVQSRVEELSKTFQSLEVRKTSEELVESAVKQLQEKLAELRQSLNALYQEKLTDSQKEVVADVLSKALNTLEQGKAGVRYLMQHIDMLSTAAASRLSILKASVQQIQGHIDALQASSRARAKDLELRVRVYVDPKVEYVWKTSVEKVGEFCSTAAAKKDAVLVCCEEQYKSMVEVLQARQEQAVGVLVEKKGALQGAVEERVKVLLKEPHVEVLVTMLREQKAKAQELVTALAAKGEFVYQVYVAKRDEVAVYCEARKDQLVSLYSTQQGMATLEALLKLCGEQRDMVIKVYHDKKGMITAIAAEKKGVALETYNGMRARVVETYEERVAPQYTAAKAKATECYNSCVEPAMTDALAKVESRCPEAHSKITEATSMITAKDRHILMRMILAVLLLFQAACMLVGSTVAGLLFSPASPATTKLAERDEMEMNHQTPKAHSSS